MLMKPEPHRGEVWWVNLDPVIGHETGKTRPGLVVSVDRLNHSGAGLVWVIPITSKDKGIRSHVRILPPAAGSKVECFAKCEEIRAVSKQRLTSLKGTVDSKTLNEVLLIVARFLGLD